VACRWERRAARHIHDNGGFAVISIIGVVRVVIGTIFSNEACSADAAFILAVDAVEEVLPPGRLRHG
jgi:hypothetical protein